MYASDYPHSDTEWERVPSTKALETISAEEKSAILGENAARFYKI
jgi:predicted TIM-barrel fold metal-dependent hydrolase